MKNIFLYLFLVSCLYSGGAFAQTLDVHSDGVVDDLQCPRVASRPAQKPGVSTDEDDVPEPPVPEDLGDMGPSSAEESIPRLFGDLAKAPAERPLSIVFWGDSHLAAHFFSDALIDLSGLPREKVETTFIPATMGRPGVRLPIRKACQGPGWHFRYAYTDRADTAEYAQSLSALTSNVADSYLWIDFRRQPVKPDLEAVDVIYDPLHGEKVKLGISVDNAPEQIVELDPAGNGLLRIQSDQALSILKIRLIEGEVALEGFVPHYLETRPLLLLDTFAIPSATFRGWRVADTDYLKSRIGKTQYDVVVFEYGTNEGNDPNFDVDGYREDLRQSLENVRKVLPAAQCILIGPADRGVLVRHVRVRKHGRWVRVPKPGTDLLKFARIHEKIGAVQKEVGSEYGCSFWSWQNAMGGPGSVYKWYYHKPRWMSSDLTHMTVPGYRETARMFADSIQFQSWVSSYAKGR